MNNIFLDDDTDYCQSFKRNNFRSTSLMRLARKPAKPNNFVLEMFAQFNLNIELLAR